jgi:hypothetical protein
MIQSDAGPHPEGFGFVAQHETVSDWWAGTARAFHGRMARR